MSALKLTPMFEQYLRIKRDHPDALLFYRMGDFYELFFEDAEVASRELGIALTSRNPNAETRVPMCGVPHHAAEGYLTQLLAKGHKVAICDQIGDPKQTKGLVERAVTRVLTPGTVVEDANLSPKAGNFLAALYHDGTSGGLAWVDFSTGDWSGLAASRAENLWQWLAKLDPREVLMSGDAELPDAYADLALQVTRLPTSPAFDLYTASAKVQEVQGVAGLEVLDLADKPGLVRACGALLGYLAATQKHDLKHLGQFVQLDPGSHLILDEVTERNLELFRRLDGKTGRGTLWQVLDQTMTAMGGRLLQDRLRKPWRKRAPVLLTQQAVAMLHDNDALRTELRDGLDRVYDLERLSTRVALGRAAPKDYVALRESLAALPALYSLLTGHAELPDAMLQTLARWDDMHDLAELLNHSLVDSPPPTVTEGGLFRSGYHPELDELIELTEHGEARLQELLEREREAHRLPKLKLGVNRVFGYYLELSRASGDEPPEHFIRRQSLKSSERYVTPELKELEDKLFSAADKRKSLEYSLFQSLRDTVAGLRERLKSMASILAELDYWQSLAEVGRREAWTRPQLGDDTLLRIRGGRHPVVEAVQGRAAFIPNDLHLDRMSRLLLITGPNMAGKSTVLRQTALIVILAQMGSYVPAAEADVGLTDRVFSRVGASDNLAQGRSTFMVEMMETARILRRATSRSLVILDEIGRGTSTFDGLALAWAVVEELARRGGGTIRTLFATHYHELTALEGRIHGLRNYTIAIKEWKGEIIFLRRLVPGPSDRSYGVEVARLAGVPQPVVQRAREILEELECHRDGKGPRIEARQDLLPGMIAPKADAPQAAPPCAPHPVLDALREVRVEGLTPLAALNLLQELKSHLGEDET